MILIIKFLYISGKLQHVYTELPFTSAICAMAYHPTEHMLALSTFGSHQPLVVYTHVSHRTESEETKGTQSLPGGSNSASGKQNGIMGKNSMKLHLTQRLKEVTKTLDRTTEPGRTQIRKKKS